MTNLNIHQKVILAAQKSKETQIKASNLSEEEFCLKDYTENIKPSFTEEQLGLLNRYLEKLHVLGDYKEFDIYSMMKKYDWNEKVLDNLTTVMIQKVEEVNDADDWIEVKRVRKTLPKKRTREERETRIRGSGDEEGQDNYVRGRPKANLHGGQRNFRKKFRRGDNFAEGATTQASRRRFNMGERRERGQYRPFKQDNFEGQRTRKVYNKRRQDQVEFKPKRAQDVYVPKHLRKQVSEEVPLQQVRRGKMVEKFVYVKKVKSNVPPVVSADEEPARGTQGSQGSIEKKETTGRSRSSSPTPQFHHYNENNIQEFFKATSSPKSEEPKLTENPVIAKTEPTKAAASPLNLNVHLESDTTSKGAQKPFFDKPVAAKEKPQVQSEPAHEQPIGPTKTSPQTGPTTVGQATQGGQTRSEPNSLETPETQHPQMFGYPQYMQQPFMMPQFPQQGFYNPYMQFYPPQTQQPTSASKDQQQGAYPPGFNPQDMSAMYQMPYVLVQQPNGTTILQPMYQMMPQSMPNPSETDQQGQFPHQPFFHYGMGHPMNPPYYGATHDDKKSKHQNYEQKTQTMPPMPHGPMGGYFNFGTTETDHKNKGGYVPQQQPGGYYMPFMMPPNAMYAGQHQSQHYHGKNTESGNTNSRW